MKNIVIFVLLAVGLLENVGCTPTHALITPATATSQGNGVTQVAVARSPYQQCVEEYALQGDLAAPGQVQATDDQGNPVTVLRANGLALDQHAVQQICLRRARLETEPQPQTCTQWGRGAPSWCWRLAGTAQQSQIGLTVCLEGAPFFVIYHIDKKPFLWYKEYEPESQDGPRKPKETIMNIAFIALLGLLAVGCVRTDHTTIGTPTGTADDVTVSGPFATHHRRIVQADGRKCLAYKGSIGPTAWDNCADEANGFAQGAARPQGAGGAQVQTVPVATAIAVGGMPGVPGYGYGGFGAPVAVAVPAAPVAAAASGQQGEINKKVVKVLNDHERRLQGVEKR